MKFLVLRRPPNVGWRAPVVGVVLTVSVLLFTAPTWAAGPPAVVTVQSVTAPLYTGVTVAVTVTDSNGNPVPGVTVYLTQTGSTNLGPYPGVTSAAGGIAFVVSGQVAGTDALYAYVANGGPSGTGTATYTGSVPTTGPPAVVTIQSVTSPIDTATAVGVRVTDSNGVPIPGVTVYLTQTGSTNLGPYPGIADANGKIVFVLSGNVPGTDTLYAYVANGGPSATGTVTYTLPVQTITFTSSLPANPVYGGSYAVSATGGGSGNPVVFSIDSSSTAGACWILNGTVAFIGPGTCVIDANQAGNADYAAAPQEQQSFTIGFIKTLSGNISTPLTVSAGQAVLLSPGTTVGGPVTVQAGGSLSGQGATIGGPLSASRATAIRLCGSTVGGPVNIAKTAGLVVIGDDDGAVACAGNRIGGPASITGGFGGVEFDDNTVGGPLTITGNTGTLPPPDTGTVDATGNKVGGPVHIQT